MRYKRKIPAHVEEREESTRTTCDASGRDVRHAAHDAWSQDEVTVEARLGDVFPEADMRTVYEVDLCGPCFREKVMPALAAIGIKFRERQPDIDDGRVFEPVPP